MQILIELLVFVAFMGLVGWTIFDKSGRTQLKAKCLEDWLLDSAGAVGSRNADSTLASNGHLSTLSSLATNVAGIFSGNSNFNIFSELRCS